MVNLNIDIMEGSLPSLDSGFLGTKRGRIFVRDTIEDKIVKLEVLDWVAR